MTTENRSIRVSGIPVEIVRKDIKNLHVGVYPPCGRVRVAAPLRLDGEAIRLAVVSRLGWIRRQQAAFEQQNRQSEREMVTGESHYFRGRRYRLDVVAHDGPAFVCLPNNTTIQLRIKAGADAASRKAVLQRWYRQHLREQVPALLAKWEPRMDRDRGFVGGQMDEFRMFDREISPAEVRELHDGAHLQYLLQKDLALLGKNERTQLLEYYLATHYEPVAQIRRELQTARAKWNRQLDELPDLTIMRELPEPRPAYVLERGAYNARGEELAADTPQILPTFPQDQPRNRLGLGPVG